MSESFSKGINEKKYIFQMWTDFWTNDETMFVYAAHEIQNYLPMKFPMRIPFNRKSNQRNFSAWIPQNSQKTSICSTFFFRKYHNNNKLCVHGNHEQYRQRIYFKWLHRQSALKWIRKMPAIKWDSMSIEVLHHLIDVIPLHKNPNVCMAFYYICE